MKKTKLFEGNQPKISHPCGELEHLVDTYWSIIGNRDVGGIERFEIFPDSSVKLVLRYSTKASRLVLIGPLTEVSTIEVDLASSYFGIRFLPGQSIYVDNLNVKDITDTHIDLFNLGTHSLEELAGALMDVSSHEDKQLIVEQVLKKCTYYCEGNSSRALSFMANHHGNIQVQQLADHIGIHTRSLERLFKAEIGLPPKKIARMMRLRKVMLHIYQQDYSTLSDLAYQCGYSDQSHMIRDFKSMTGLLPSSKYLCEPQPIKGNSRTKTNFKYKK